MQNNIEDCLPPGVLFRTHIAESKLENCKTISAATIVIGCVEKVLTKHNVQRASVMVFKEDDTFGDVVSATRYLICEFHIFKEGITIVAPYKIHELELVVKLTVYDHVINCELTRHTEKVDDRTGGHYSYNRSFNKIDDLSMMIKELDDELHRITYKRKFANVDQVIESFAAGVTYTPKRQSSYKQQIIDFITKLLPD